jgi:hypothetical protein
MQINNQTYLSNPFSISLRIKGENAPLTYDSYIKHHQPIQMFAYAVAALSLLMFVVSIFYHKMVGL